MQPQEDLLANNNTFPFSSKLKDDLQKTAQWAKISAILTLCGVVVVLLQAMFQHINYGRRKYKPYYLPVVFWYLHKAGY